MVSRGGRRSQNELLAIMQPACSVEGKGKVEYFSKLQLIREYEGVLAGLDAKSLIRLKASNLDKKHKRKLMEENLHL